MDQEQALRMFNTCNQVNGQFYLSNLGQIMMMSLCNLYNLNSGVVLFHFKMICCLLIAASSAAEATGKKSTFYDCENVLFMTERGHKEHGEGHTTVTASRQHSQLGQSSSGYFHWNR